MKRKFIVLKGLTVLLLIVSTGIYGCKKKGVEGDNNANSAGKTEVNTVDQKVVRYLSITLGVKTDEITFNKNDNTFNIRSLKLNKDSVLSQYNNSNEYKLKYENK